jgi:hypothetical protein
MTDDEDSVRTDVRLEDPKSGDLFANCPYEVNGLASAVSSF